MTSKICCLINWYTIASMELDVALWLSVHSLCDGSSVQSLIVDPLRYFSFQSVLHNWGNKSCCISCPVCGVVHIKDTLLIIEEGSP